jgi:hypothetical protein
MRLDMPSYFFHEREVLYNVVKYSLSIVLFRFSIILEFFSFQLSFLFLANFKFVQL